jgi:predicted CXXCH cytochrome family protein
MTSVISRILAPFTVLALLGSGLADSPVRGQTPAAGGAELPEEYTCAMCHFEGGDLWTEGTPLAKLSDLTGDVHWQAGLRCHDCHGGSPSLDNYKNHRDDPEFHRRASRADVPGFCGRCHSDIDYMRQFVPSARTDQEAEYWSSGHGRRLKASTEGEHPEVDQVVATCVDCHGGHGILAVRNTNSRVYPTHVAETCAHCHADEKRMAGRTYEGRPLGHDQYEQWRQSVHGRALMDKGDLSAPACNDCHGNHGALPPEVGSVAHACGTCHGKIAGLFAETRMQHKFEEVGLPGCAACHGKHLIGQPTDELLGMQRNELCFNCHNPENPRYGATLAGAEVAMTMRKRLDQLKQEIDESERLVAEAERLGMEVRGPRFDLRQAFDALTDARTQVHTFNPDPLGKALDEGLKVTAEVKSGAEAALHEHTARRIWLAASLVPILIVVALLLLYIRTWPVPADSAAAPGHVQQQA